MVATSRAWYNGSYHGRSANQNPGIALYNDPIFNNTDYTNTIIYWFSFPQEPFDQFGTSMMTMFVMTLGELNYHDTFTPWENLTFSTLTNILFVVLVLGMPIIMMNMLVRPRIEHSRTLGIELNLACNGALSGNERTNERTNE